METTLFNWFLATADIALAIVVGVLWSRQKQ